MSKLPQSIERATGVLLRRPAKLTGHVRKKAGGSHTLSPLGAIWRCRVNFVCGGRECGTTDILSEHDHRHDYAVTAYLAGCVVPDVVVFANSPYGDTAVDHISLSRHTGHRQNGSEK
jgi:hypothetical protein